MAYAGKYLRYSKPGTKQQDLKVVVPSFEWLRPGDRVGLKKTADNRVLIYYNCELLDTFFEGVPDVSPYTTIFLFVRFSRFTAEHYSLLKQFLAGSSAATAIDIFTTVIESCRPLEWNEIKKKI